jgi:hypothetical protein
MTAPDDRSGAPAESAGPASGAGTEAGPIDPVDAVRGAAESVVRAGAAAAATGATADSAAEKPDDEVIDGEIVDRSAAAGADFDDDADPADAADPVDAEIVAAVTPQGTLGSGPAAPAFDYTDQGVPTLDYVRDKIEGRWGTAMGRTELAEGSQAGRQQQEAADERARLAQEKLAELRRQVDGNRDRSGGAGTNQI